MISLPVNGSPVIGSPVFGFPVFGFPVLAISFILFLSPFLPRAADAQSPGKDRSPVDAEKPVDPLLRKNWIARESKKARGFLHRLSLIIEKPRHTFQVRDAAGRKFRSDFSGKTTFNPFDDNWSPVVPRLGEVSLHLAEAEALYRQGMKDSAVALWKAILAMSRFGSGNRAAARQAARVAVRRMNHERETDFAFEEADLLSDPYVYYDDLRDLTVFLSDRYAFRISFPGLWRTRRGQTAPFPGRVTLTRPTVFYLRRGELTVTVGMDIFALGSALPDRAAYLALWDRRRNLTARRKDYLRFRRIVSPLQGRFCKKTGGGDRENTDSPSGEGDLPGGNTAPGKVVPGRCAIRETVFLLPVADNRDHLLYRFQTGKEIPPHSSRQMRTNLESVFLQPPRGLYVNLDYPADKRESARKALQAILERLHIGRRSGR